MSFLSGSKGGKGGAMHCYNVYIIFAFQLFIGCFQNYTAFNVAHRKQLVSSCPGIDLHCSMQKNTGQDSYCFQLVFHIVLHISCLIVYGQKH